MKYIVIGLGNFGSALCSRLSFLGHEIIAVDEDNRKIDEIKEKVESAVCLDSKDIQALKSLPLTDSDGVIVTIGEDFGTSVYTLALLKQIGVKRVIGRALSELHKNILEAIGIDEIIMPEQEYAESFSLNIDIPNALGCYTFSDNYKVIEMPLPTVLFDKSIADINFKKNYGLQLISVKKNKGRSLFAKIKEKDTIIVDFDDNFVLERGDTLLLYGKTSSYKKFAQLY